MADITCAFHNLQHSQRNSNVSWNKVLDKGGEPKILENVVCDQFRNIGWKENYQNETKSYCLTYG